MSKYDKWYIFGKLLCFTFPRNYLQLWKNTNFVYKIQLYSKIVCKKCLKNDRIRVFIRKTFAQFLRNETKNFSFIAHQFGAKKQQFVQSFAKVISRKNCPIPLFRNWSFAQFRNFVMIIVYISWNWNVISRYLNSGKIWFWSVLLSCYWSL